MSRQMNGGAPQRNIRSTWKRHPMQRRHGNYLRRVCHFEIAMANSEFQFWKNIAENWVLEDSNWAITFCVFSVDRRILDEVLPFSSSARRFAISCPRCSLRRSSEWNNHNKLNLSKILLTCWFCTKLKLDAAQRQIERWNRSGRNQSNLVYLAAFKRPISKLDCAPFSKA